MNERQQIVNAPLDVDTHELAELVGRVVGRGEVLCGRLGMSDSRLGVQRVVQRTDNASSGDENIDTAKLVDNLLEAVLDLILVRNVTPETDGLDLARLSLTVLLKPVDELGGGRLGHFRVEVEDGDGVRAGLGERTGEQVAELGGVGSLSAFRALVKQSGMCKEHKIRE